MLVPEKRIADFEKMGFGMFVHWGLYSQLGKGEWILCHGKLDEAEYSKLKDTFTAENFDADELVLTAKKAGCKYITLTTRHHEGFSLYDTCGLTDYDAPHSPAKRDLVREFVNACNKHSIVPFFYHTTIDWHNHDYVNNFDAYLDYFHKSVEILCTNYGKVGGFWFDGNWDKLDADWKEDRLYAIIRRHQPDAMIINNTGLFKRGESGNKEIDSVTFEQGRPAPMNREGMTKYLAAEMCYTLNDHWGVGYNYFNFKSPMELIESLCDCRKVGANLLLNIGPDAQGGLQMMQASIMDIIGRWMNIFGEAIYEGKPYKYKCMGKNFVLKGDKCLYIFCYDLARAGSDNVVVGGKYMGAFAFSNIEDKIKHIKWMDNEEELEFVQSENILSVNLTGTPYGTSYCVRVAKAEIE